MRTLYLDTETTGLNGQKDRLVEIALVGDGGEVVINTLINPGIPIPSRASDIHGITDAMVRSAPSFETLWAEIQGYVRGNRIVIYNAAFDTKFFPDRLSCAAEIHCAMRAYAVRVGEKTSGRGGFRLHNLAKAAAHVGHRWSGQAHRALGDAEACRSVWLWTNRAEKASGLAEADIKPHVQASQEKEKALIAKEVAVAQMAYAAFYDLNYEIGRTREQVLRAQEAHRAIVEFATQCGDESAPSVHNHIIDFNSNVESVKKLAVAVEAAMEAVTNAKTLTQVMEQAAALYALEADMELLREKDLDLYGECADVLDDIGAYELEHADAIAAFNEAAKLVEWGNKERARIAAIVAEIDARRDAREAAAEARRQAIADAAKAERVARQNEHIKRVLAESGKGATESEPKRSCETVAVQQKDAAHPPTRNMSIEPIAKKGRALGKLLSLVILVFVVAAFLAYSLSLK
jgi:DNA polymerase III epsilon subunit-like protein